MQSFLKTKINKLYIKGQTHITALYLTIDDGQIYINFYFSRYIVELLVTSTVHFENITVDKR